MNDRITIGEIFEFLFARRISIEIFDCGEVENLSSFFNVFLALKHLFSTNEYTLNYNKRENKIFHPQKCI